jgi:hypothetical protein
VMRKPIPIQELIQTVQWLASNEALDDSLLPRR